MISFVIPAHNEEAGLGRTLEAIHESARALGQPYEIVVANDASTDRTAEVAEQHQARVVSVNNRQIAATRNSGARAALGERFFFVDADTTINARSVAEAMRYMDKGAVGGGGPPLFEGPIPLYLELLARLAVVAAKFISFTGGAFMFCTREAYLKTGGFDERLFWSEEGAFAMALKREGRFVVLWHPVRTSARRFRSLSWSHVPGFISRLILSPRKTFTDRSFVQKIWYDSNRSNDNRVSNSVAAKISNAITLVLFLVLLSGPVWNFIPWKWTPWGTPLGRIRDVIAIFLCHVGLLFWPVAIACFWNLLKKKHWVEWLKLAALFAFCLWQAWGSTLGVIGEWRRFFLWLPHF